MQNCAYFHLIGQIFAMSLQQQWKGYKCPNLQTGNNNEEWGEKTMKNVQDVEEQAVNSSANFWFTAGGLYVEHCL